MKLSTYLETLESPIVWFSSVAEPTGGSVALIDGNELPFSADLSGKVDQDGNWQWDGEDNPADFVGSTVMRITAYSSKSEFDAIVADLQASI